MEHPRVRRRHKLATSGRPAGRLDPTNHEVAFADLLGDLAVFLKLAPVQHCQFEVLRFRIIPEDALSSPSKLAHLFPGAYLGSKWSR